MRYISIVLPEYHVDILEEELMFVSCPLIRQMLLHQM